MTCGGRTSENVGAAGTVSNGRKGARCEATTRKAKEQDPSVAKRAHAGIAQSPAGAHEPLAWCAEAGVLADAYSGIKKPALDVQ